MSDLTPIADPADQRWDVGLDEDGNDVDDAEYEDQHFDLMRKIAERDDLDWDRHRGLIHERALAEESEKRTISDSESGGNAKSFVEALTDFTKLMADLKANGNPALFALTETHPDDDPSDQVFTPAFKAKCRALLAARDYAGMLDAMAKQAKADRDELELEVCDIFDSMSSDDDNEKVTGTIPVPLGAPYGTVKFKARATPYAKIVDDERLQEYLEQRALVDGYVSPSFSKGKLHTMVREILENPDGKMPPGLTYTIDRGMTITRQK